ncbi:MAG TPA: hypothetical protein VN516_07400, partial [Candidatus Baltobacteraceae bacterium]|nr:hypothetical protein [Candidatus Baltobacteraceae bacterium]
MANFRKLALFISALIFCVRAGAQGIGLLVTASPNPVVVSNSLTFTIAVTNQAGVTMSNVVVTNTFSAPVLFTTTNSFATNANQAVGNFGTIATNTSVQRTFVIHPLTNGVLTNFVVAATNLISVASTNVTVFVIHSNSVIADLGVGISGAFTTTIFSNDWFTFNVAVTNFGPPTVTNVMFSNNLSGVKLIGVTPTNQTFIFTNGIVLMNLGAVTNGTSRNFQFTIQPTNTGVLTFTASVNSTNIFDSNSANDSATANLTVSNFLDGTSG